MDYTNENPTKKDVEKMLRLIHIAVSHDRPCMALFVIPEQDDTVTISVIRHGIRTHHMVTFMDWFADYVKETFRIRD